MPDTKTRTAVDGQFIDIHLDCIRIDSILNFDLFLDVDGRKVLYRSADLPFTDETRQKLLENRVERLFISSASKGAYQRYIEKNLDKVIKDPRVSIDQKATILYETSTELVKDVFDNPTYGDNIQRSKALVTSTIDFVMAGRDAFLNLMRITSFDYYTYTHSVNVCTFAIALARQLGIKDQVFLHQLGVGALLHDVGKARVAPAILSKKAPLSTSEFEIMKQHPKWGVEMLSGTDELTPVSLFPVLQHHERGDRGGYPNNLSLEDMHRASRIVAICDTFDAMTTNRVYQPAMDTFGVLRIMFELEAAYDQDLMRAFTELMGPHGLKQS